MNKELYTTIRGKTTYDLKEVQLILNKYANVVFNKDFTKENVSTMFNNGLGHIVQRTLPSMLAVLDRHYNIISIIDSRGTVLMYLTNNYNTEK